MAIAFRRTSSSLINKLSYVAAARVSSLPSTVYLSRSFNTKAPPPPYIIETPPYLIEFPCMKGVRKGFFINEDENNAYFRIDMPGVGKENVDVAMEKRKMTMNMPGFGNISHTLVVREVGKQGYEAEYDLSPTVLKTDEIAWLINNGVLRILVPRMESDKEGFRVRGPIPMEPEGGVRRLEWDVKEEEGKGLVVRVDMPGLAELHVKVFVEADDKTLVVEGQGDVESKYEGYVRRYTRCKLDIIDFSKTERTTSMENGVFLLTIPPK